VNSVHISCVLVYKTSGECGLIRRSAQPAYRTADFEIVNEEVSARPHAARLAVAWTCPFPFSRTRRLPAKCLHSCYAGIIHCDLKPANFVLVAGRVKLIDFGIANELEDDVSSIALEHAAGTLNFMAPEVLCPVYPSASSVAGGGRGHDGTDGRASAAAGHDKKTKVCQLRDPAVAACFELCKSSRKSSEKLCPIACRHLAAKLRFVVQGCQAWSTLSDASQGRSRSALLVATAVSLDLAELLEFDEAAEIRRCCGC